MKVERSSYGSFESYEHLLNWADQLYPLLKHNDSLHSEFKELYDLISSDEELDRSIRYPTINKMLGFPDRAIGELKSPYVIVNKRIDNPTKNTNAHWHEKPIGKVMIGVVIGTIMIFITWIVVHYVLPPEDSKNTANQEVEFTVKTRVD